MVPELCPLIEKLHLWLSCTNVCKFIYIYKFLVFFSIFYFILCMFVGFFVCLFFGVRNDLFFMFWVFSKIFNFLMFLLYIGQVTSPISYIYALQLKTNDCCVGHIIQFNISKEAGAIVPHSDNLNHFFYACFLFFSVWQMDELLQGKIFQAYPLYLGFSVVSQASHWPISVLYFTVFSRKCVLVMNICVLVMNISVLFSRR